MNTSRWSKKEKPSALDIQRTIEDAKETLKKIKDGYSVYNGYNSPDLFWQHLRRSFRRVGIEGYAGCPTYEKVEVWFFKGAEASAKRWDEKICKEQALIDFKEAEACLRRQDAANAGSYLWMIEKELKKRGFVFADIGIDKTKLQKFRNDIADMLDRRRNSAAEQESEKHEMFAKALKGVMRAEEDGSPERKAFAHTIFGAVVTAPR